MKLALRRLFGALGGGALLVACGSNGGETNGDSGSGSDGGTGAHPGSDASTQSDGATSSKDSGGPGNAGGDGAPQPGTDAGPPPWTGTFSGPLTCSGTGAYKANWSNSCGVDRWSVKTGSDGASGVNMTPQLSTVATLVALSMPTTSSGTPRQSAELQTYAVKDATLIFARLEDDSDYHLVISDGTHTFIGEIPYPGCVTGGPLACNISRARATVDANLTLVLNQGHNHSLTVSIVGVAFSDFVHGQYGAAPNMFEMHAVLAICFGAGCDPTKT